ncbi:hypothetical protein BKA58DRAFT_58332 [Alternaria rosae]|uniref:uncharacterized protein n=1 Tax=Alternaria rosae TaxID=1187941 RepID=UPI001E8E7A9D|nr:uncharacterized protein BKA58DRAFT_58332 [Alternaria rosae]KAH6857382.1 hypothetical protein BKA58DRAFT_58332 [Alternaria rosae]
MGFVFFFLSSTLFRSIVRLLKFGMWRRRIFWSCRPLPRNYPYSSEVCTQLAFSARRRLGLNLWILFALPE